MVGFYTSNATTNSANQYGVIDGTANLFATLANTSGQTVFRINNNSSATFNAGSAAGLFEFKRTSSVAISADRNNSALGSSSSFAVSSLPNRNLFALATNSNGTPTGFNANTKDVGVIYIGAPTVSGYDAWNNYS